MALNFPVRRFQLAIGCATTHCPYASKNSKPTTNSADAVAWQYATRAIDRKEPVIVAIVNLSPAFQRRDAAYARAF